MKIQWFPLRPAIKPLFLRGTLGGGRLTGNEKTPRGNCGANQQAVRCMQRSFLPTSTQKDGKNERNFSLDAEKTDSTHGLFLFVFVNLGLCFVGGTNRNPGLFCFCSAVFVGGGF